MSLISEMTFLSVLLVALFGFASAEENYTAATIGKWFTGIETWTPSPEMVQDLPFFISGHDLEGRPIFVSEFGRWNVSKYLNSGNDKDKENFYRRSEKLWYDSVNYKSPIEGAAEGFVIVLDARDFKPAEVLSVEAIRYQLWNTRLIESLDDLINEAYFVNVSFMAAQWVSLVRPVAGKIVGRAHILGPRKDKIIATLRQKIAQDQLPPWLGGSETWKPFLVK